MATHHIAPLLADLHLLTVLADTQSFTQAARQLGISKASVSTRIAELERAAGTALVRRTTRSVSLSPAGQQLVGDTQASFARIAQGFADVRDLAGAPRGLVRMTAPVALGRQRIAPLLPEFLRRYPEIRLELDLNDRLVNLVQEGFDLAVRHSHAPPDSYVAWALAPSKAMLVASPDYLARRGAPAHPSDLARHDCLAYPRDGRAAAWSFEKPAQGRRAAERVAVPVSGPFKANNSEVLREAMRGGLGIALLPDFSLAGLLAAGDAVPLLAGWRPVGFFGEQVYAMRPWAPAAPRAVQCLVDHLRSRFAQGFGEG
jgi:DNA-binding transcriptional LysR family regulator